MVQTYIHAGPQTDAEMAGILDCSVRTVWLWRRRMMDLHIVRRVPFKRRRQFVYGIVGLHK